VPLSGASAGLIGRVAYAYDTTRHRLLDWGMAFEGRANAGKGAELLPIEAYVKVRFAMVEVRAGRSKEIVGLTDPQLSSGSFAISGNALGVPKVQLSIPDYYTLPILGRRIAVKGTWAHGWLGEVPTPRYTADGVNTTFFHQKTLYGRYGKPEAKVQLYGGFSDQAFWGNENRINSSFIYSNAKTLRMVALGQNWAGSKVGNHLGTIEAGMDLHLAQVSLTGYRQQIYEAGGLYYLANIADGLTGLRLTNKRLPPTPKAFHWKKLLVEFVYTKDQAGQLSAPLTPTGAERYYNHYIYTEGYSFLQRGLGSPLITPAREARLGLASFPPNFFINNRLWAVHGGLSAALRGWEVQARATFSKNFGTYETSGAPYRQLGGRLINPPADQAVFVPVSQLSTSLSGTKPLRKRAYVGVDLAGDIGGLLEPTVGMMIRYGVTL
jgi:hypothetical protein